MAGGQASSWWGLDQSDVGSEDRWRKDGRVEVDAPGWLKLAPGGLHSSHPTPLSEGKDCGPRQGAGVKALQEPCRHSSVRITESFFT